MGISGSCDGKSGEEAAYEAQKWKIRSLGLLLLMVLLTDGALAGTAFAVARHLEVRTDAWQTAGSQRLGGHSCLLHSPGGRSAAVQPSDSPSSTAPPSTAPLSTPQPSTQSPSAAQPFRLPLTFDDGPHQTCTPALLDGLKQRGVKATFFLMGKILPGKKLWYSGCRRKDTSSATIATATSK